MACPSDSMHIQLSRGELPSALELAISKHLDDCPECRSRREAATALSRPDQATHPEQISPSEEITRSEQITRSELITRLEQITCEERGVAGERSLERCGDDATQAEPLPATELSSREASSRTVLYPAGLYPAAHYRTGYYRTGADAAQEVPPTETMYRLLSAESSDDVAGIRLGRFVIQRWLGAGGFGIVFLAHDELLRRDVALKLPAAGALSRPEARERFLCEAEAAAQLYHPNVVPVFEAGEEQGVCYIATAYCPGPTLDAWLAAQTEPVSVQVATSLIRQLSRGVEHAHSHRVLHRDIKPSNILLEPSQASSFGYTPKLTDFGLAKILDGDTQMTGNHGFLGTPRYMAPEQALSKADSIGPATDVFALGAVLYELLTGVAPYAGGDYARTLHRLLYEQADPPRQLRPGIPRDLEAILLKCLEKRSSDRYPTAQALAEDLRRFQEGRATQARPIGRIENLRRWTSRQPAIASMLMVVGLAVLSLLGILVAYNRLLQNFNADIQRALTLTQLAKADGEAHRSRLGGMLYVSKIQLAHKAIEEKDLLQASRLLSEIRDETPSLMGDFVWRYLWSHVAPQGREITSCEAALYDLEFSPSGARLSACGADGNLRIYDGVSLTPIITFPTAQGEVNSAVFSPDERSIVTAGDDGTARIWDLETATPRLTIQVFEDDLAFDAVFTPDGQTLVVCGQDPVIYAYDVATGQLRAAFQGHTASVEGLAMAPDGSHFASACSDETVRVWDLESQKTVRILEGHEGRVVDVQYSPDGEYLLSGAIDQTVRLWRVSDGKQLQMDRHLDAVCSVAFRGDHHQWVATDRGGSVRIWQRRSGDEQPNADGPLLTCWKAHDGRAWEVTTRNGSEVLTAGADGKIQYWGEPTPARETIPLTQAEPVPAVAIDPHSEWLHFSDSAHGRETWEFASHRRITEPPPRNSSLGSPDALCMLPDRVLVTANREGAIEGVELESGRVCFRFQADTRSKTKENNRVRVELKASADGSRLAFFCEALTRTYLYAIPEGTLLGQFELPHHSVTMALSPDGQRLAMMDDDRVVVWDTDGQRRIAEFVVPKTAIYSLEFCPDGRFLAAAGEDRRIRLWNLDLEGHPVRTLDGHLAAINALSFSPDGELLASGDERGEIKFWFLREAAELMTLNSELPIRKLCFSPDGKRLVELSKKHIQVFHAPIPTDEGG